MLAISVAACSAGEEVDGTGAAIIGGSPATDYPEAVTVDAVGVGLRCSGVLIAPRLALTAAHCTGGNAPLGFLVTAPFAPDGAQRSAHAYEWTAYDLDVVDGGVPPGFHDVAVLHLDAPIELDAYPVLAEPGQTVGEWARLVGRKRDGELTDSLWVGPEGAISDGTGEGFAHHYAIPGPVLESGDSGGPMFAAGLVPHLLLGVNSGTLFPGPGEHIDLIARIDIEPVAGWLERLVAQCGSTECNLPVVGYVDAGPVTPVPCPEGQFGTTGFYGEDVCCTPEWQCFYAADCPALAGEPWTVAGRPGVDRCLRHVELDMDWRVPSCPAGQTKVVRAFFGEYATDVCLPPAGAWQALSDVSDCQGLVVQRLGQDLCVECGPGQRFEGTTCVPRPLLVRDVTHIVRSDVLTPSPYGGGTQYLMSALPSNPLNRVYVHLISADNRYEYTYPGTVRDGHLLIGHSFATSAARGHTSVISYVDASGAPRTVTAYFPAFVTTGGRKMYFWVAEDGSTFYADAEHDGLNFESSELLRVEQAMRPEHLAASRTEVTGLTIASPPSPIRFPDRIAPGDQGLDADGLPDGLLELSVTGAVRDIRLAVADETGAPFEGVQWDTFTEDRPIPSEMSAGFTVGAQTWVLGVERAGGLLNVPGGLRPSLGPGRHTLRLYAPTAEIFAEHRFRVDVLFADGSIGAYTAPVFQPAVNECETPAHLCHWAASCIDLLGSYTCQCNDGFTGSGFSCGSVECGTASEPQPDGTCLDAVRTWSATYGGNCGAPANNARDHVRARCDSRRRCTYTVDVAALGDPAPGCAKEFVVQWNCGWSTFAPRELRLGPEANGRSVTLVCE